jgi:hypothetical protein
VTVGAWAASKPPVVAAAADKTIEATGPDSATVTFAAATVTDDADKDLSAACPPASGSKFALGKTTVTLGGQRGQRDLHGHSRPLGRAEQTPPPHRPPAPRSAS